MGGGGFKSAKTLRPSAAASAAAAEQKRLAEEQAFKKLQASQLPGVRVYQQTAAEKRAGVMPPSFAGVRDINTGELLSQYKIDPYAGEAAQKLKEQAFAEGLSPWAKIQMDMQKQEQMQGMDLASKQGLGAMNQGLSALAMQGGLSSGARERMARMGARDLMAAKQNIARQGIGSRLGIQGEDVARKSDLLGKFADAERGAQASNIEQMQQDLNRQAAFDANRYGQQMQSWAAAKSAQAQRDAAAASKPSGGCCFIFLEARYGNGTMDAVVRRYRDEFVTEVNQRGYYKLSEVLVPLMRKSRLVKFLVRILMTDSLVAYGKFHYGENRWGFIFKPIKNFWLGIFETLGGDTKFVRESGELV